MTELFLIAHKVRGQPAFDIARQFTEADGWGTFSDPAPWWIIPTSGHRAYPYWSIRLDSIEFEGDGNYSLSEELAKMPHSTPDHYTVSASKAPASREAGANLLAKLNLLKPRTTEPIKRRV